MQYVYLAMAAIVLALFGYKKFTASKKTNEYLPKNEKNASNAEDCSAKKEEELRDFL